MPTEQDDHRSYPNQVSNSSTGMHSPWNSQNNGAYGHDTSFLPKLPTWPYLQLDGSQDSMIPSFSSDNSYISFDSQFPEGSSQQQCPEVPTMTIENESTRGEPLFQNPVDTDIKKMLEFERRSEAKLVEARNMMKVAVWHGIFDGKEFLRHCIVYTELQREKEMLKLTINPPPERNGPATPKQKRDRIAAKASNRKKIAPIEYYEDAMTHITHQSKLFFIEHQRAIAEIRMLRDEIRRLLGRSLPKQSSGNSPPDDPPDDDPARGNPGYGNPGLGGSSSHGISRGGSGEYSFPGGSSAGNQAPTDTLSVSQMSSNQACTSTAISDTVHRVGEKLCDRRLLPGAGASSNQTCAPPSKNCDTDGRAAEGGTDKHSRSRRSSSDNLPSSDASSAIRLPSKQDCTSDSKNCDTADRVAEGGTDKQLRSRGPSSPNLPKTSSKKVYISHPRRIVPLEPKEAVPMPVSLPHLPPSVSDMKPRNVIPKSDWLRKILKKQK